MNHENDNTIVNQLNNVLIPRLHERKKHYSKTYNYNKFLGNKRLSENNSESKKHIF